jgi:hypothetical protein
MRRFLSLLVTSALLATSAAGAGAQSTRSVDRCLAHHGWAWGIIALKRAELREHHANGLDRLCTTRPAAAPMYGMGRHR